MAAALFEKFPPLFQDSKRLVWDTRQERTNQAERILIAPEHSPEIVLQLRKRQSQNKDSEVLEIESSLSQYLAELAIEHWGHATRKLKIFGVTGTNGKSTTIAILRHLLIHNKFSCCELGTLGITLWRENSSLNSHHEETGFTTPEAHQLHYLFHCLLRQGIQSVVMEVSSHAIELERIRGVEFEGGIFTNLTQDHLDFHKSMELYEAAKFKFFSEILPLKKNSHSVVNSQSEVGRRFVKILESKKLKVHGFSRPENYQILKSGDRGLCIQFSSGENLQCPMVGDYNAENLVGAVELLHHCLKIDKATLALQLKDFVGVSGRLERVTPVESVFHAFVDYAHTPDALEKVLMALKEIISHPGKLWCVFGCGGDRDAGKRPLMGEIAARLADSVIVTSDNPRTEGPQKIVDQILAGVSAERLSGVTVELDRERAIHLALSKMKPNDILVVAGKGHEQYQIVGSKKLPFSDQQVIRDFRKNESAV